MHFYAFDNVPGDTNVIICEKKESEVSKSI